MARLKTDWILFLTILAMVGVRAGDAVQRIQRGGRAALWRPSVSFRACGRLIWAVGSFFVLMYFKRRDYHQLNTPAWAFSGLGIVLGMLVMVYFAGPARAPLVPDQRAGLASAFRIRQAGADSFSGVFRVAPRRRRSTIAAR